MRRRIELSAVAVVVRRTALECRKGSVLKSSRDCGRFVPQYMNRVFGLYLCIYAARFDCNGLSLKLSRGYYLLIYLQNAAWAGAGFDGHRQVSERRGES